MREFAKIFKTDVGQILVILDTNDEGNPSINIYFKPDGLGVCRIGLGFTDDGEGWDRAEYEFNKRTEEDYYSLVLSAMEDLELL